MYDAFQAAIREHREAISKVAAKHRPEGLQ